MRQACSRLQKRVFRKVPDEPELPDITCEIGYRYPSAAAAAHIQNTSSDQYEDPYAPLASPGSRFPHVLLARDNSQVSTLDLIKTNFVLFTTGQSSPWIEAARGMTPEIDTYSINRDTGTFRDPDGTFNRICKISEGEAILVRPDGFIAWQGEQKKNGHKDELQKALGLILSFTKA
jgi:hypothetical protein